MIVVIEVRESLPTPVVMGILAKMDILVPRRTLFCFAGRIAALRVVRVCVVAVQSAHWDRQRRYVKAPDAIWNGVSSQTNQSVSDDGVVPHYALEPGRDSK
jgi:hypothetical protein